jgi:DNA invertase Pin-like site-specific DNA recombinase
MADMLAKGRDRVVGTRNGRAKLTPDDVREIRRRCADGEEASTIAVDFGISRSTVYDIKSGRIWKSVVLLDNVELT